MPLEKGVALCKEAFGRLRRAAKLRRTRCGAPRLDVGSLIREIIDVDLPKAREVDLVSRVAAEAARAAVAGGGGSRGGGAGGAGADGAAGTAAQGLRGRKSRWAPAEQPTEGGAQRVDAKPTRQTDKKDGDEARAAEGAGAASRERPSGDAADKAGLGGKTSLPPISLKVGSRERGAGAVDTLQTLIAEADPDTHRREYPCAWALLFGSCAKGPNGCPPCEREASGAKAKPLPKGVLARVKAACVPALRAQLKA
eukprot:2608575-Pleurochrysis_carterae.AAC.1